jgi:hypothetical protein
MKKSYKTFWVTVFAFLFAHVAHAQFNYSDNGNGTVTITGYTGSGGAVTIPGTINGEPVIAIGDSAFANSGLTSVTIPSSVTSIGDYSFGGNTGLTSVTIPSSITSIAGGDAFEDCTSMTQILVDPSNGAYASSNGVLFNKSLTQLIEYPNGKLGNTYIIPTSVTSIGSAAFEDCTFPTSITIPSSVTSIGDYSFTSTGLTSVTIPNSVTAIGQGVFEYCTSLTSANISNGITLIPDFMFDYCTSLASVFIPSSVTSIGYGAFFHCTHLASVNIPASVTGIGTYAFNNCQDLTSVTIPASVTFLGEYSFAYTGLTGAYFQGNAPASFGVGVFYGAASSFTVYYYTNFTGFSTPTWNGYNTVAEAPIPAVPNWALIPLGLVTFFTAVLFVQKNSAHALIRS